jgi:hypothetical protein
MTSGTSDRSRTIIVARYHCRCCEHEQVRHFFSVKDYNHDIMAQNLLCMRCYLDDKYEPGSLVTHDDLPVLPYPEHNPRQLATKEE